MHQVGLESKSQEIHIEVEKIQQISQLQTLSQYIMYSYIYISYENNTIYTNYISSMKL